LVYANKSAILAGFMMFSSDFRSCFMARKKYKVGFLLGKVVFGIGFWQKFRNWKNFRKKCMVKVVNTAILADFVRLLITV